MVKITPIPLAAASATEQNLVIEIEKYINPKKCVYLGSILSGTINYTTSDVYEINNTAIATIVANGSMTVQEPNNKVHVIYFIEKFEIPFAATTDNTITITAGSNIKVVYDDIKCCKSNKLKLVSTLDVVIS